MNHPRRRFYETLPRPRNPVRLSDSVHRHLNMYALAAGAAGVGAIASAQLAEAKIVYTPAHVNVSLCHKYGIDLDHKGKGDIYLNWCAQLGISYVVASSYFGINGVAVARVWPEPALAIFPGAEIGPARLFFGRSYRPLMAFISTGTTNWSGRWANGGKGVKNRYLGIKFKSKGQFHYGWARITLTINGNSIKEVLLTGYAYETIPGKPIIAGATKGPDEAEPAASLNTPAREPASLGMLAMGAPGLSIWRREDSVAATLERN